MRPPETAITVLADPEQGAQNLLINRLELGAAMGVEETDHTPPAAGHYPDKFYWDGIFAAIISARAALVEGHNSHRWARAAMKDVQVVADGVQADGFLPNLRYTEATRSIDPERMLAIGRSATSTNYTQPPVLALGIRESFDALRVYDEGQAKAFLSGTYDSARRHYGYFARDLSNHTGPADKLTGVYHPHMTGRDSDPTFDSLKPHRLQRRDGRLGYIVDKMNVAFDYGDVILHGIRLRGANGDIAKMREVYWMNDVMMNCIYVDNLRETAELARQTGNEADELYYEVLADEVEHQILDSMWFPEARDGRGGFYALDKNGEPINEVTVSNLFPLVLANLREDQLEALLDQMDASFNVPFPLPSVATDSVNYDPHNREAERLWRGPVWINTNWYLAERGLKRQAMRADLAHRGDLINRCVGWHDRIALSSRELVDNGLWEHYNPYTGQGQRKHVRRFGWSNLGFLLTSIRQK